MDDDHSARGLEIPVFERPDEVFLEGLISLAPVGPSSGVLDGPLGLTRRTTLKRHHNPDAIDDAEAVCPKIDEDRLDALPVAQEGRFPPDDPVQISRLTHHNS
ncbi:hypothetical protein [Kibdelosporangium aridum]|uniref:hypothetical protein n=1 Tax=Kibdelosporangium aridum TaxID=2030 RepID=UPI000F78DA23|nr:hypothetical protein [Kibdelosporangium aridum]